MPRTEQKGTERAWTDGEYREEDGEEEDEEGKEEEEEEEEEGEKEEESTFSDFLVGM